MVIQFESGYDAPDVLSSSGVGDLYRSHYQQIRSDVFGLPKHFVFSALTDRSGDDNRRYSGCNTRYCEDSSHPLGNQSAYGDAQGA